MLPGSVRTLTFGNVCLSVTSMISPSKLLRPGAHSGTSERTRMSLPPRLQRWLAAGWTTNVRPFIGGCVTSLAVHAALLLLLALVYHAAAVGKGDQIWFVTPSDDFTLDAPDSFAQLEPQPQVLDAFASEADRVVDLPIEIPEVSLPLARPATSVAKVAVASSEPKETQQNDGAQGPLDGRGGFEGRLDANKGQLIAQFGGSKESEDAVAQALAWLAAHQRRDGSWRFTFDSAPCNGRCRDAGTVGSTTGATALALLPFLGAGHLPDKGPYGELVKNGLYYLRGRLLRTPLGGDLQEGTMYAHGLAAITLCEAYAMTRQEELRPSAQLAIDFIANVQHAGGGWRYYPGQPGDTTVFGWQLMALKSAQLGGLTVPSPTIDRAKRYLDSVQADQGAFYGYARTGQEPGPTAVGLLSRMYFGWKQDDPRLDRGVSYLAKLGPSRNDMYFNYYASQVLRHYGGPHWRSFNERLQEHLVASQARSGHERGSWHFTEKHGTVGGRLYTTAICAMILEVYYRHLPLYGEESVRAGF